MANKEINQTAESLSNLNLTTTFPTYTFPAQVMYKGLSIPMSWKEAADTIAYDSCTCPPPVVLICGAGNTGKSVFGRVILDTLFKRYQKVGYLEADVGQPEFTAPGCVSLHIIEDKTPDLTVLCMKTPKKCFFFGDTSPNTDTEDYARYTTDMFNYFLKECYKRDEADETHKNYVPLIVNTPDWIEGSRLDVLVGMIRCMNPTHVVKVYHSKARKNLPDGAFSRLTNKEKSPVGIIDICAIPSHINKTGTKKETCQMRETRFIAYFRQCLPKEPEISIFAELISKLSSLQPFELSLSKINISYLHSEDSIHMTCGSLMGMIIGLAVSSGESSSTSIAIPTCVGLGIVRFIDTERGKIFLIAPISRHIVEKVDVLLRGSIKIPPSLMLGAKSY